ncbi:3-hydroxyacyl-CoA dehydrogenase family protein [Acaricomes phytoseiuli]|uniref:3-hydroxyacyl-CoA dehydrogenase family protein n=1 Tax=Acaricomes phytoseiuli TaxID=291968 RepID=UPI002222EF36|nr:3-hydroxyacyl-CoA dehydrogenase family protein [Acaricomes phytoseiuli]MCW1250519.1 3-hydroxyacyl-CoA dehydrogenase family protein [Acaricomes phytoseiuli]
MAAAVPKRLPERIGVIGGGRMGAGIAHAFLTHGCTVSVVEADAAAVPAAYERVAQAVAKSAERGLLELPAETVMTGLRIGSEPDLLEGSALVVEAVPEDFGLKADALRCAEEATAGAAVLASNTSSLSIDALAAVLRTPERFLGLHFFNPVPASKLIEVVVGESSGPELVRTAQHWCEALGKRVVTVQDSPGFASSRLGLVIALEAMRMLEAGVASAEDIDAAMELGYKHPMGPLRTSDVVGLDVRLGIAEYLAATLGPRFDPPQLLRDKVARGELGRKSGQGFFSW